jgi:two-component system, cell cycle response regulator
MPMPVSMAPAISPPVRRIILATRILLFLGTCVFVVHSLVPDTGWIARFCDNWLYDAIVFLAAGLCGARALLVERNRSGWLALALALALWAGGDTYYTHVFGNDPNPPAPSIADIGYLGFFPFAYAGFILLVRSRVRKLTPAVWLDGITAVFAVGALGAAVVFEVVLQSASGSAAAVATNLAYPLGDVILLALIVGAFSLMSWRPGRAWLVLGAGLAVNSIGDSVYLFQVANGTYQPGAFLDSTWPIAMVLLANAAWVSESRERAIDAEGRALQLIPVSCVSVAVGVLIYDHFARVNVLALSLAAATIAAVVVRLALTFRENTRLFELTRSEAVTDSLTGLANRRRLVADLDRVMAEATLEEPWLLLLFDLDGFKRYNDSFGHPAGDALLNRLGTKLGAVPPPNGAAYRLGGDEFCVLAPATTSHAANLIEASVEALSEQGEGFAIGTSFGAVFIPDDATEASAALSEADARLYAHKHQKNTRRDKPHEVLLQALYERDAELKGHTNNVAALAVKTGRRLGLPAAELEEIELGAQLHDIGKLAVPDDILHKPGPLTDSDWSLIRQHTIVGQRILSASPSLRRVGEIVRATHERWDGTGYPDRLMGEAIPFAARLIAVCDAFDAMTSTRAYRPPLTVSEAIAELQRCAGGQFEPALVAIVVATVADRIAA